MLLKIVLIFFAGILVDALVTWYTRAVAERKPVFAATMSGALALLNMLVIGMVVAWAEDRGFMSILAFAGGNWVGTYVTVKRP
jgi:hypothetical protein